MSLLSRIYGNILIMKRRTTCFSNEQFGLNNSLFSGDTLLHRTCRKELQDEAVYLAEKGANLNKVNHSVSKIDNAGATALLK